MLKHKNYFYYVILVLGVSIAFYADSEGVNNQYLLILAIGLMMVAIYNISKNIPSKKEENNKDVDENE